MKRFAAYTLILIMSFSLIACSNNDINETTVETTKETVEESIAEATETTNPDISSDTIAGNLCNVFIENIDSSSEVDLSSLASTIIAEANLECDLDHYQVSEGFLDGFTCDITGFESGEVIKPYIGSIPLVAYIFKVDNPDEFKTMLEENSDPQWNICTEADDTLAVTDGQYVFFVMAPSSFE